MSHYNCAWAGKQRTGDPVLKGLLLAICNYTPTNECWVSQKRIAFDTEIPERSLRRKLAQLAELGLIRIEVRRRDDGTRDTNIIHVLCEDDQAATVAGCEETTSGQNNQRPKRGGTSGQKGGSPAATMVASIKNLNNLKEDSFLDSRASPDDGWPDDFLERFWTAFPPYRREGKRKVGEKLARLRRDKVVAWDVLIGAVMKFAATGPGEYAPAPMVWLNGERWDREYGNGGRNEADRNGAGKVGFSGLAAKLRQGIRESELFDRGCPAEDPGHVNRR